MCGISNLEELSLEQLIALARAEFEQRCGRPATVVSWSPGRVNLIGEHTDYNEGYVLPMVRSQVAGQR